VVLWCYGDVDSISCCYIGITPANHISSNALFPTCTLCE
jgi:hypothetical protein